MKSDCEIQKLVQSQFSVQVVDISALCEATVEGKKCTFKRKFGMQMNSINTNEKLPLNEFSGLSVFDYDPIREELRWYESQYENPIRRAYEKAYGMKFEDFADFICKTGVMS